MNEETSLQFTQREALSQVYKELQETVAKVSNLIKNGSDQPDQDKDLLKYFEKNQGNLIFKWMHYFEIYERHFSRFRNKEVHIVEIGVFHGGSLQMWRDYFGAKATIYGVDINSECKKFEDERIKILIGDQGDKSFLKALKEECPRIDILIDDGSHFMEHLKTTFEELFPHISENGIYLAEDLHTCYWSDFGGGYKNSNNFIEYTKNLIDHLTAWHSRDPESFRVSDFTRSAYSIHYYDSVVAIEKRKVEPPYPQKTGVPQLRN
jgi:23S rRNA U2552 (ribose-2'-O)-methylase RlmE/FtsJ